MTEKTDPQTLMEGFPKIPSGWIQPGETERVPSKAKCRCGSKNLILTEVWHGQTIEFTQENGIIETNGWSSENQDPAYVIAKCHQCSHEWKLKKVQQITDVYLKEVDHV